MATTTLTGQLLVVARVASPGIIAIFEQSSSASGVNETVGAVEEFGFTVDTFPVAIAVGDVGHHLALDFASVWLRFLLRHSCSLHTHTHTKTFRTFSRKTSETKDLPEQTAVASRTQMKAFMVGSTATRKV